MLLNTITILSTSNICNRSINRKKYFAITGVASGIATGIAAVVAVEIHYLIEIVMVVG